MKFSKAFLLSSFALAGMTAGVNASAEKRSYGHWESFGSSGAPGGVTYSWVIDGWLDDGAEPPAQRFPNSGRRAGPTSIVTRNGKVDGRSTPGKGCTIAANSPPIKGLPAGTRSWAVFISPLLDTTNQIAFRSAMDAVNNDQKTRGRSFRLVEVPAAEDARVFISDPKPGVFVPLPGTDATTDLAAERNGDISRSWTVVYPTSDLDYATARAGHEIGHALGLDDVLAYDPNYPTLMFKSIGVVNKKQRLDACTAAAIDANVNRGKN